jgi:hypothetical protein
MPAPFHLRGPTLCYAGRDGAIIFGDKLLVLQTFHLHPAQLMFFRHSQMRLIHRLDFILVLPIAFRKLLNDLVDRVEASERGEFVPRPPSMPERHGRASL